MRDSKGRLWLLDILMLPFGLLAFFPFYIIIVNTFKTEWETAVNPTGLPASLDFSNYGKVFAETPIVQSFGNSLFLTVSSVVLMVLIGAMAAYPIVYNPTRLNRILTGYLLLGFMVPFQTLLVPLFQLMTDLRLVNKLYGLTTMYLGGSVFVFFLIMGYMRTIPRDLSEAAIIDGCSVWSIFWRIILPLLQPITMTCAVLQTMWIWNDFLSPMLFLSSRENTTLVLEIYKAKGEFAVNWPMFMTMTVITLTPVFIFFVLMQKQIIKGIVGGAVKG